MKKSLIAALSLSLLSPFVFAEPKKPAPEPTAKPAAAKPEAKKEDPKVAKKPVKKTMEKPEELSESDKALVESAKKQSEKLTPAQRTKLLDLVNKGDTKAVQEIDGVGEGKAANIIKDRPYTSVEDIIMVDGIGESTFEKIIKFAKGQQPKDEVKPEPKKMVKPEAPKTEKKPEAAKPKK